MSTPVLQENGEPYKMYVRLLCTVNIGKDGVTEIYHQVRPIRKKKLPEILRDAVRKHELSPLESKLLVIQDTSNQLTTRQRLRLLRETINQEKL
jgi:hypothetical protein